MVIRIHTIGEANFLNSVETGLPSNKNIRFFPYTNYEDFLNHSKSLLYTITIIQKKEDIVDDQQLLAILDKLRPLDGNKAVFIFSESPTLKEAIRLVKEGADEYLGFPRDVLDLTILVSTKFEEWSYRSEEGDEFLQHSLGILGTCPQIEEIFEQIKRLSLYQSLNVLVTGETGTGKELVARAIHNMTFEATSPFVEVNASAIPDNLIESELFGYEKGAFTGAVARKHGLFEAAKGGTLFLDEIGDLGFGVQSKLLRAIEQKTIMRVGGTEEIPVSVRIIVATNKDLAVAVKQKEFREDLFYRLRVACIHLPPLREREGDAVLLAEHFLRDFCKRFDLNICGFTTGAKQLILEYPWPGNVRELRHAIERSVISAEGNKISKDLLQQSLAHHRVFENDVHNGIALKLPPQGATLDEISKCAIKATLKLAKGNKRKAARILGISAPRLYRKMVQFNFNLGNVGMLES